MSANQSFAAISPADVPQLLRDYPLAWVVSSGAKGPFATLLPMSGVQIDGQIKQIVGHFARSNPQVKALRSDPSAMILCLGPHGYISPSWYSDRAQAPSWNYASSQFIVDIELFEEPADIESHLRDLVSSMEVNRTNTWDIAELGERYQSLARGVIGFKGIIREVRAKFKLGQDERDDGFSDITQGLLRQGNRALLDYMLAFNQHRHVGV